MPHEPFPVIDIFAGPGGLGEGFSSYSNSTRFKIALSIEKDEVAHKTLFLRSFFRHFEKTDVPKQYYQYMRGESPLSDVLGAYPKQTAAAHIEAWCAQLGKVSNDTVAERINNALDGRKKWVLIGGPPCQAYSVVGRARMKGDPDFEDDERHYLYREYLRIIARHNPPIFVMENVKGILSSKIGGKKLFNRIHADLENPSAACRAGRPPKRYEIRLYRLYSLSTAIDQTANLENFDLSKFVVRCEDYGVPQARHRVILLGVRHDVQGMPSLLSSADRITAGDVLEGMPTIRSGISKNDSPEEWSETLLSVLNADWYKNGLDAALKKQIAEMLQAVVVPAAGRGAHFLSDCSPPRKLKQWLSDTNIGGICQHQSRSHMKSDIHRYLFAASFATIHSRTPTLSDFPDELLPLHKNVKDALEHGTFKDRFRVQLFSKVSSTVTCHIAKDGHYFIHPDAKQCRSLTVREAARLQTFPDNYFFEGNRSQQYQQVGNAVPPYLARDIAGVVAKLLE